MIILDTNVLSTLMQTAPAPGVVAWLDRQPRTSVWTTSITVLEIHYGLLILPAGKRRKGLMRACEEVLDQMEQRVVGFDAAAAQQAAELMAARQKRGRLGDLRDTMIAGIVQSQHATLATRNVAHFRDMAAEIVNPWEE